jgi:hypothetical protein
MGEYSESVAANGGGENGIGSGEAQDFVSRKEENCGGTKGTVGEAAGAGEEGGIKIRRENNPLLQWRAFLFDKELLRL